MKFSSPAELKSSLSNYVVAHVYDLYYEKNGKDRLLVKCCKGKTPQCPFRSWAFWMKDEQKFQIKFIKDHSCLRAIKLGSIVTYKWIGKQYVTDILESPTMSLRKMKAMCRNAKRFALCEIEGDLKDHYSKLWEYGAEIKRANQGSHVEVYVKPKSNSIVVFERFYVSFKGVVDGWLDGCRKSTWKWFLDNLMEDIDEGGNGNGITLMLDGHKGIMEVVKERCPKMEHMLCARHILANFHKKFKGGCYIKPFWRAVKGHMIISLKGSLTVGQRFFKVGMGCDAMENGVSESFNDSIEEARKKPLITMLEDIRVFVMERLCMQKGKGLG
ncbi:uncharacterized protein LOC111880976 [Lactuca sativa]|uniref:uncharacterized protein LOC111880976 n=1 Tax=Lactuca sativa TaxID=4236 RepID=UPI000CD9461A|nr:uncharacterized protein LOC111880976 [Lactuca sativa]